MERKRREREEEERKQQEREQTEEKMKSELEGERRKRAEELRSYFFFNIIKVQSVKDLNRGQNNFINI